jgi:4-hydroxybenzoate polyprenyltransferase
VHVLSRISRPHRISTWLLTVWTVVFGAWIVGAIVEGAPGSVDSGIGVSVLISLFFAGITMIGLVALITRDR